MEEKKIHLCDSCGGHLKVDLEKQIYICPFCGVTYDYEYFKEDDILEKAETFVERGELDAALDAYKFYLTKDPHDFRTLKKVMLLTYGLKDINELRHPDTLIKINKDPKETEWIVESASEKDREYFKDLQEIFVTAKQYRNLYPKLKMYDDKIKEAEYRIWTINGMIGGCYVTFKNRKTAVEDHVDPKIAARTVLTACIFTGSLVAIVLGISLKSLFAVFVALIFVVLVYVGFYYVKCVPAMWRKESFENEKSNVESSIEDLKSGRKGITDQLNVFTRKIRKIMLKYSSQDEGEDDIQTEGPW